MSTPRLLPSRGVLALAAVLAAALCPGLRTLAASGPASADSSSKLEEVAAGPVYTVSPSDLQVAAGETLVFEIRRDSGKDRGGVAWRIRPVGGHGAGSEVFFRVRELAFEPGETSKRLSVRIEQKVLPEGVRGLEIVLEKVAPGTIGSPGVALVSLEDVVGAPLTPEEFAAPVLSSVDVDGDRYRLSWSHTGTAPEGGFDIVVDGADTETANRTGQLRQTVGPLDPTVRHCFMVEAQYEQSGLYPRSNELCTEAVRQTNQPPKVSGAPAHVAEVGRPWSFRPVVSDPEGDPLTYTLRNRPRWAEFDAATGELSGTPAAGDRGVDGNIVLSVSDGVSTVQLPAFDVEVRGTARGDGTATLSWSPPTRRVDGSRLDNLAGYRVYVGPDAAGLEQVEDIRNPGVTSYIVEGLTAGEWAFAITAYDGAGRESAYGNIMYKAID